METVKFLFMQVTAMFFTVVTAFIVGLAFGAGVWVAWRGLDRRAARLKSPGQLPGDQPQRQQTPLS